jgi:hypothetical protein
MAGKTDIHLTAAKRSDSIFNEKHGEFKAFGNFSIPPKPEGQASAVVPYL